MFHSFEKTRMLRKCMTSGLSLSASTLIQRACVDADGVMHHCFGIEGVSSMGNQVAPSTERETRAFFTRPSFPLFFTTRTPETSTVRGSSTMTEGVDSVP